MDSDMQMSPSPTHLDVETVIISRSELYVSSLLQISPSK